jgi:hypothetical protein
MSDWQQQAPQAPEAPEARTAKSRTGLIVLVVVVVLVLLLCCCGAVGAWLWYSVGSGPGDASSTATSATPEPTPADPAATARGEDWRRVQAALIRSDYAFVAPDARQRRLADEVIKAVLPDFSIDELKVEPGSYDAAEKMHTFDSYLLLLHLTADPSVRTAYSFDVGTVAADEAGLAREDLELTDGDEAIQIEGTTWVLFPTRSKAPLLRGMKDPSFAALMKLACEQWQGGLPTKLMPQGDGSVLVSVETWDSYCWSETFDRIDASYERDGQGWTLRDYTAIVEPKDQPGTSTQGATQI